MDDQQFMNEQQFLTPKDVLGYAEEYIVIGETKELLNYSLSNNLDNIEIAIYARTGLNIDLKNVCWRINTGLSVNVKYLMNKHRVNYSVTTWYKEEEKTRYLVVNMRAGDKWFFTSHHETDGIIYDSLRCSIFINAFNNVRKRIMDTKDIDIYDLF